MNAKGTRLLKAFRIASLFLPLLLPHQAPGADLPAGKVVWWGKDIFWQRIYSDHTNGVLEYNNEILTNVVGIAAGYSEVVVLKSDGTVLSLGTERYELPAGLSNVASVAVEGGYYWGIRRDGTVVKWGRDARDDSDVVQALTNITAITVARYLDFVALKMDGTALGFHLDRSDSPLAPEGASRVRVGGRVLSNISAFVATVSPFFIKKDGTVHQLGWMPPWREEFNYDSSDPVSVGGQLLSNVAALAVDGREVLTLRRDGTVMAWDLVDRVETSVPAGLSNVTAISMNQGLRLALKSDGTVAAWGENSSGRTNVPAVLSNVVAISVGGMTALALITGDVPPGVFIQPHGRLEEMEREADLIFKGRVISSRAVSNASFPDWGNPHATRFRLISILAGKAATNELGFWHNTSGPNGWGGGRMPSWHNFEPGQSYLVFAATIDKADHLYTPPPNAGQRINEYRQLYWSGVMRTLDSRPVAKSSAKKVHWAELMLLLKDANPTNQLYGIGQLDNMSLAGRRDDEWSRSDDFKRNAVLTALLPLITNKHEQVANRALECFVTESNSFTGLSTFVPALISVANASPSGSNRLAALTALAGEAAGPASDSLIQLLTNAIENIRVGAVVLLTNYPAGLAEMALRERSVDRSVNVRSVVAEVIGDGKYEALLPVLEKLLADPAGRDHLTDPLPVACLQAFLRWSNIGDVHTSAGFALVKFEPEQVAGILKANLADPGFHITFVSKLAEKDAGPWLPELVSILEARIKYVEDFSKLPPLDPKRFEDHAADRILVGSYSKCWEDIRQYLLNQPAEKLAGGSMDRYLDLLEKAARPAPDCSSCANPAVQGLYELYSTKGLTKRAGEIRRSYPAQGWWFDDYDRNH